MSVLIQLALTFARVAMVFLETGRRAKMLTNARTEPIIAVSMLTVQIASDLITASVTMDFMETAGHAQMSTDAGWEPTNAVNTPSV